MSDNDRIFFENITGYSFILMFAAIMFAVNPLFIFIPVVLYYSFVSFKYIKNHPVDRNVYFDDVDSMMKVW